MDIPASRPGRDLPLPEHVVHVWQLALPLPDPVCQALARTLSPDEQSRAGRFQFARDRHRFTAVRGALRAILGHYTHTLPAEVHLVVGEYGKPSLGQPLQDGRQLHFNVSHAGTIALLAFAWDRELGVDVELLRPLPDMMQLARSTFAPAESAALRALPPEQRLEAFFTCWTRKEAYVKARGLGLTFPLESFVVTVAPGEAAHLSVVEGEPDEPSRWRFLTLAPAPGYVATLVGAGCDWEPQLRRDLSSVLPGT